MFLDSIMSNRNSEPSIISSDMEEEFMVSNLPSRAQPKKPKFVKRKIRRLKKGFMPKKIVKPQEYVTDPEMINLKIPNFLQHAYLTGIPEPKIVKFRDWQAALFQRKEWISKKSALLLIPTSGGKTIAADVAIAQTIADNPKAKCLYTLPFVALANEKYSEYNKRFFQHQVRPYYQNIGGADFRRGSIAVCTYEKAHALINSASSGGYLKQFKLVVIDEVHMLGEEGRGPTIEALIVKLLLMPHHPRIILLTATLNIDDANRIGRWINGFTFVWSTRPSQVKQFVKFPDGNLCAIKNDGSELKPFITLKSSPDDREHLLPLVRTLIGPRPESTILIFVNTRPETLAIAHLIAKHMFDESLSLPRVKPTSNEVMAKRESLLKILKASGGLDDRTEECVRAGIMYHHGGLLMEDRKAVEAAAREGALSVLVATTTLSAGVNIHGVTRVILHNIYRNVDGKRHKIAQAQYTQMIGRAGRGKAAGEAYVIARSKGAHEINDIIDLSKQLLPPVIPRLHTGESLERFFLQCVAARLVLASDGLEIFTSHCLQFFEEEKSSASQNSGESDRPSELQRICEETAERLRAKNLIASDSMAVTKFGLAVAGSALPVDEAIALLPILDRASEGLCLSDEVHMLYLCVSPQSASKVRPLSYDSDTWQKIFTEHKKVVLLVTGLSEAQVNSLQFLALRYGGNGRVQPAVDRALDRVLAAVILQQLVDELPISSIVSAFQTDLGTVQRLQMESASYAGQVTRFCELSGRVVLAAALAKFRQRLNFAARADVLALLALPSCGRATARALADAGVSCAADVVGLSEAALAAVIAGKAAVTAEAEELARRLRADAAVVVESMARIEEMEDRAVLQVH